MIDFSHPDPSALCSRVGLSKLFKTKLDSNFCLGHFVRLAQSSPTESRFWKVWSLVCGSLDSEETSCKKAQLSVLASWGRLRISPTRGGTFLKSALTTQACARISCSKRFTCSNSWALALNWKTHWTPPLLSLSTLFCALQILLRPWWLLLGTICGCAGH